jgi:F-type H+-transporting ATPase subunit delta
MKSIIGSLEKRTGKTVLPETHVDPSVISGISAKIGGLVFDGTLRSQIERLRADLR